MLMPLHYKDLRDELDEILWHFNIPKKYFHRLLDLRQYMVREVNVRNINEGAKLNRALEIIQEIMPPNRLGKNSNEFEKINL